MVLRKAGAGSVRPYIPGKGAWSLLIGTLALATFLTFSGADRALFASTAAASDSGDTNHIPVLKAEIHHAGA